MEFEVIQTEKKKPQLIYQGHCYRINRRNEAKDTIYWRCVKKECKSKLKTNLSFSTITAQPTEHLEPPNPNSSQVKIIKHNMRTMALESSAYPRNIISNALRNANPSIFAILPDYQSLQRTIQNVRSRNSVPYILPQSGQDLVIPEEFKISHRNERFLLSDTFSADTGRIIIFCTDRAKDLMRRSKNVFFDGTFKTVPVIFFQLFTIHCEIHGNVIPCVFVLMERKSRLCYQRVWMIIREKILLNFENSMCDFEIASIAAFQTNSPNCQITGCFFHFTQNIWRKIQSTGLHSDYLNNEGFRLYLKMIPALAFCEPTQVFNYIEPLEDYYTEINIIDNIRALLDYFEDTYIGRLCRNGRGNGIFSIPIWNQYDRVLNDRPRTNNSVEGWHNAFSRIVNGYHPNIFYFLNSLKDEQSLIDVKFDNLQINTALNTNRRSNAVSERMKTSVQRFHITPPIEYLKNIANLFNY